MDNIQIQHEDGDKWVYLVFNKNKIIGQTEKGTNKIAQARWEEIPGTNLKMLVQIIESKPRAAKTNKTEMEEAPARVKRRAEPVEETKPERTKRRAVAQVEPVKNKNNNKRNKPAAVEEDAEVRPKNTSRRPSRPAKEVDFSDVDF
jgi:hypothetical protein